MSEPLFLTTPKEHFPTKSINLDNNTIITAVVTINLMSRVRWGNVDVSEIPQYTNDEERAVWYDDDELEAITHDAVRTVTWITREPEKKSWDACEHTTPRGLEEMTADGIRSRIRTKVALDAAIIDEQKRQKQLGIRDEEALARVAQAISEKHVEKAVANGLKDQACADLINNRHLGPSLAQQKRQSSMKLIPQQQEQSRRPGKEEGGKHSRFKLGFALRRVMGFKR